MAVVSSIKTFTQIQHLCKKLFFLSVVLPSANVAGQQEIRFKDSINNLDFIVQEAPEWTALFKRQQGWFGGDGIFATPLSGNENIPINRRSKNLIWFSDSMIGDVSDSTIKNSAMVHNATAIIKGRKPTAKNINFFWAVDESKKPKSSFIPTTASSLPQDYYWLGDGFINTEKNNTLYIFGYKMRNSSSKDAWSFKLTETILIAIKEKSRPPFTNYRQIPMPSTFGGSALEGEAFGAAIFVNTKTSGAPHPDGFIYIYGVKGKEKNLVAARVKPELFEDFTSWTFWDGKTWVNEAQKITPIATGVSNELSVSALPGGKYGLIYQLNGISSTIALQIGESPVGPFSQRLKLYECQESKVNKNIFSYNAKAHPSLSSPGELLISYNINAFDFLKELGKEPTLYRPRFIKLKFQNVFSDKAKPE